MQIGHEAASCLPSCLSMSIATISGLLGRTLTGESFTGEFLAEGIFVVTRWLTVGLAGLLEGEKLPMSTATMSDLLGIILVRETLIGEILADGVLMEVGWSIVGLGGFWEGERSMAFGVFI